MPLPSSTFLPSPTPFHPARLSQSTSLSSLLLAICFTHGNVYISVLASQFTPPSPSPSESISSLFSKSVSLFLPSKQVHRYHFSRFHIYALIYCVFHFLAYFTLTPTLKFIYLSTTDLNVSLLWLSNIPLYIPQLLYPQMMSFLSVKQVLSKKRPQQNFSISVAGTITKLCSTLRVSGKAGNRIVLGRLVILPVKTGNIAT